MVRGLSIVLLAVRRSDRRGSVHGNQIEAPQVAKLERFRKALWKVHVTVKDRSGDLLLDTGGTLLRDRYFAGIDCKFWGRTTGYNMFVKRIDGPH